MGQHQFKLFKVLLHPESGMAYAEKKTIQKPPWVPVLCLVRFKSMMAPQNEHWTCLLNKPATHSKLIEEILHFLYTSLEATETIQEVGLYLSQLKPFGGKLI